MPPCAVFQDGKYDRLLRLLYDDIEKYETEVTFILLSLNISCMLFIVIVLVACKVISIHVTCISQKLAFFVSADLTHSLTDRLIHCLIH